MGSIPDAGAPPSNGGSGGRPLRRGGRSADAFAGDAIDAPNAVVDGTQSAPVSIARCAFNIAVATRTRPTTSSSRNSTSSARGRAPSPCRS
jgi:hypothetical protein